VGLYALPRPEAPRHFGYYDPALLNPFSRNCESGCVMRRTRPDKPSSGVVRLTYRDRRGPKQDARSHCRHCISPFARRFGSKDPQR
jgi:hypothetical protein